MPEPSSAVLAFEKAQQLMDRCDAFFNRKEARAKRKETKKAAKRAKRDGDDPSSSPGAPPDFREDGYYPEERSALRTGGLSKGE